MATAQKAVEAADVVEDVKELVEDTAELVEVRWIANPRILVTTALLAGVAIGGAATFWVVRKKLTAKFQAEADAQVQDVKNHYSAINKDGKSLTELAAPYTREEVAEERVVASEIATENGYTAYEKVPTVNEAPAIAVPGAQTVVEESREVSEVVHQNIFESDNPDTYFDMAEEVQRRAANPESPHVITKEEFDENESGFEQAALVYYDGDDVLTDKQDQPIEDIDKIMGYENLLRFGHGSGDPSIVYISNPRLELDFEVVHSDGKFAKEVLGFDDGELRHSSRSPRKFRDSDD